MADEVLRRNLQTAFDPGSDFPSETLVSRTVASLPSEAGAGSRRRGSLRLESLLPLVAALLVITLVVTLVLAGRLLHDRLIPVNPPPILAPSYGSGFRYVGTDVPYMVNETTGWNVSVGVRLMRTTDGGAHWALVPGQDSFDYAEASWRDYAIDATHAWVAVSRLADTTLVYRTADAGVTWSKGESIPTPGGVVDLFFLDSQDGWMLSYAATPITGYEADTPGPVLIYRTTDGGSHWTRVGDRAIPTSGCYWDGVSFASTTTGWLSVNCTAATWNISMLFVTRDGGVSWSPQSLPISTWTCRPRVPTFTDSLHGMAIACDATGKHVLLETSDGGRTWNVRALPFARSGLTPPPASQSGWRGPWPEQVGFADAANGWAVLCNGFGFGVDFYRTDDGGRSWHDLSATLNHQVGSCPDINFLNPYAGLAWKIDPVNQMQYLYATTDGGNTWNLTSSSPWVSHFP
jgi:photosystem II stability/assembly factor-like uncharacterized protein